MNRTLGVRATALAFLCICCLSRSADAQELQSTDTASVVSSRGAFFALSVHDLKASIAWYERVLGLRRTVVIPANEPIVGGAVLEGHGIVVELLQRSDATRGTSPAELTYGFAKVGLVVGDFDGTVAALRKRGVEFFSGPYAARPGMRANVMLRDNAGNMLQILGPPSPQ